MTLDLETEAERMQRVPGIVFRDGTRERVPCIVGTGLEVWEVILSYRDFDKDIPALCDAFALTVGQVQAALTYARLYADEVEALIAENDAYDIEKTWAEHPFTRPPWR